MDPMTMSLALSGLSSGAKALQGLKQKRAADKIKVGKRRLDPATEKAVADIQTRATGGKFAGQDIQEELQGSDVANLLKQGQEMRSPSQYSGMIGQAMGEMSRNRRLNQMDALKDRRGRQDAATAALEGIGGKREAIEEKNITEAISQKQNLAGAAAQNLQGALSDATGAAANYAGAKMGTKSGSGQQNAGEDASLVQQPDPNTITTKAGTFSVTGDNDPEYQAFLQGAGKTENLAYAQWKAKYKN
jgi:hypothetical protein